MSESDKGFALALVRALPDDASLDRIIDELSLAAALMRSEVELKAGQGIPHLEVKSRLADLKKRPPGGLQSE